MSITRRRFTVGAGAGLVLVVIGCGGGEDRSATADGGEDHRGKKDDKKANLATEPFLIGPLDKYRRAGLYQDYKKDKGVWVVSDGRVLVALSATCTHLGCSVGWKETDGQFYCPCHKSRFDRVGVNLEGSKAKRPLERCSVRVVQTDSGGQVEVDPTRRLRQDKGEWSDPASSVAFG